jgi:hypothetical protein
MELAVADVDRDHVGRAPLEQAVGEAAGGRTGVESGSSTDVDPERVEGGVELLASPADECRAVPGDAERLLRCDET